MKKIIKFLIFIIILAAIALGVKIFLLSGNNSDKEGAFVSAAVEVATISTTISATGSLEPVDQVEIGTQVSGDISKIYVDFNSKVRKGQIIAELDKSKLKALLEQTEIAYKSAEIDYNYKKTTYERTKKLRESNSASAVDLETAEYNMNAAKFALARSKSEVAQAKLNLSYATIKSPINGVVLERAVDVGQTVAASMSAPTLFIIAKDLSQMKVMASVDEADIGQVKKGQPVTFTVDAFQNETFNGSVQEVRLNPTTTSNVVTYTVVITAENPKLKLLPGMTATCSIITKQVDNALIVPAKALKFNPTMKKPKGNFPKPPDFGDGPPPGGPGGDFGPPGGGQNAAKGVSKKRPMPPPSLDGDKVWINVNGRPFPRPVTIGVSDGVNVEIKEGLSEGDSVIVSQETVQTSTTKEEASSPFMPGPPGKKKK